jgi:Gnt-I system low-affinity gluconate transporter
MITALLVGISVLLILILRMKINAFVSLLTAAIITGLMSGMNATIIIEQIMQGLGNTLGFVAIVVGLGAMLGSLLEATGSTQKFASKLLDFLGKEKSRWALALIGFIISIPVFFDVAFIILVPLIYSLQRTSTQSLAYFALPMLAGMCVSHGFIPPTPGPIAAAEIVKADLGLVIFYGTMIGLPCVLIGGLLYGGWISKRIHVSAPIQSVTVQIYDNKKAPPIWLFLFFILLPLILILTNTASKAIMDDDTNQVVNFLQFLGHPVVALLVTLLLALYFIGHRYGMSKEKYSDVLTKSLEPVGQIILITGAGGALKQILVESKIGVNLAEQMQGLNLSWIMLAYIFALIIRVMQGSTTVAMITAAGLIAPLIENSGMDSHEKALITLAIAAGATACSHFNDSGFWLVKNYLQATEQQALRLWTATTSIISISALIILLLLKFVLRFI